MSERETIEAGAPGRDELAEIAERLSELVAEGHFAAAAAALRELHPADAADVIQTLELDERRQLLAGIEDPTAADILEEMDDPEAAEAAAALDAVQLAAILDEMETDEAADVLGDLPPATVEAALFAMDDAAEAEVRSLLGYPDDTAGGRMTSDFAALSDRMTARQVIEGFRDITKDLSGAYYVYAVDDEGRLVGVVDLRELLRADAHTPLGAIARRETFTVDAFDDQETAAQLMARYDLLALPVLDPAGRLVGVIHHDDLVDVLVEEATEDMYRMVGIGLEERPGAQFLGSVRRRLPWLVVNLATQLLLVVALLYFQDAISEVAALAVLFPIVTGQGGNVGAQTMTVMVRSMALGQVDRGNAWRIIGKEMAIGGTMGLAMGLLAGIIALVIGASTGLVAALVVAVWLAMALNLAAGALAGAFVPLILEKMGIDPALASSMLVTTVTDTMGVVFFMGLFNLLQP